MMKPPTNRWSSTTVYRRSRNESAVRRESEPERMALKPPSSSLSIRGPASPPKLIAPYVLRKPPATTAACIAAPRRNKETVVGSLVSGLSPSAGTEKDQAQAIREFVHEFRLCRFPGGGLKNIPGSVEHRRHYQPADHAQHPRRQMR